MDGIGLRWGLLWSFVLTLIMPPLTLAAPAPEGLPSLPANLRVGLQVGHWRINELPAELASLRTATGGSGGGVREVDLNLAVAQRVAEQLARRGVAVDLLPATVPMAYRADLFLAIHADAVYSPAPRGFKLARSRLTRLPETDRRLVELLTEEYGRATGLPWSPSITRNMTGYYAFRGARFRHAIDAATPAAILEMGYLTNVADRAVMLGEQERVIDGIVRGVVRFLATLPPLAEREQPAALRPLDCRLFPETGYEICGPFRQVWERQGGLARFGFPISEEGEEPDEAGDRQRTVQYFERARLELPASMPLVPEAVEFGLIGRLVTRERQTEPAFQPVDDPGDGTWFVETGHTLHHGFRAFWEATGGLQVHGFPISQELSEIDPATGRGLVIQYFERSRFEYHPDRSGAGQAIQLGHLGRRALARRAAPPASAHEPDPSTGAPQAEPPPTPVTPAAPAATPTPTRSRRTGR